MSKLSKELSKLFNSGEQLPSYLLFQVVCTGPDEVEMPLQLEQMADGESK